MTTPTYCDRHPSARAASLWFTFGPNLEPLMLSLCGHDTVEHGPELRGKGWEMIPESPVEYQTKSEMDAEYTAELQREWNEGSTK